MKAFALLERRWVQWGLICACWAFVAVFYTTQTGMQATYAGASFSWWRVLRAELVYSCIWIALTFTVVAIDRRFPLDTDGWRRALPVHVAASILISALQPVVMVGVMKSLGWGNNPRPFWEVAKSSAVGSLHVNLTFYWGIMGVRYILTNYRKYRERELRAASLEAQLAQSQLQVLKMQLHPHFLFNTLNTISVLMQEDPKAANRTLVRLSDLLRVALDEAGAHVASLRKEMEFLEGYLEIERTRFQDRLRIRVAVEPGTWDAQVPAFILQPLVENAVRHGISPRAGPGLIEISARREGNELALEVLDNGGGPDGWETSRGLGISNTRARLAQLYGSAHRFEIGSAPQGGTRVRIVLPFRSA